MPRLNYAIHPNASQRNPWRQILPVSITDWRVSAYSLLVGSFLLIILSNLAHGDELTGLPHDDPKDLLPTPPAPTQPVIMNAFAPMPSWARGASMPALPYQLTPMGKKPVVVTANTPAPLAPPKDTAASTSDTREATAPKPAPAPETPAMVTVSPFLQWIKSNPQAAAAQARQQTSAPTPTGPIVNSNTTTAGAPAAGTDPYWLPPLIDSADFGTTPVGGSAAIYSTPQR